MLLTPANLSLFFSTLETRFWTAYGVTEPWAPKISDMHSTGSEQLANAWIGMLDKYRLWAGSRITHQPAPQTYLVQVQNFELTEQIDLFKLQDDQFGIYAPTVAFMGMQAKKIYDYQLRDMLLNQGAQTGVIQNCLDGLPYFSTNHPVDFYDASKGTYCNNYEGTFTENGIVVGGALTTNGFNTLWESVATRKSESGEALGIMADLTMVPPQLKAAAATILQSQFYAPPQMGGLGSGSGANAPFVGAMDNVLRGWTDLFVNADISAQPTQWYVFVTKGPLKPLGIAMREAPDFVYRVNPQDPVIFDTHTVLYGSKARFAPFWTFPWLGNLSSP